MFSSLGLFHSLACPDQGNCNRVQCIFSHRRDLPTPPPFDIPVQSLKPSHSAQHSTPAKAGQPSVVPAKRAINGTPSPIRSPAPIPQTINFTQKPRGEPPRKLQKLGNLQRPLAVPAASQSSTGVPILRINAAHSRVAIPVRQTMLKTLYDHFVVLYHKILSSNPSLASEHALKQEEEIYNKSSKLTYRNAVIQCAAVLKRRPIPDNLSHLSVGTENEILARAEARKSLDSLRLTRELLEPLCLSISDMEKWGYMVSIPQGPGGDQPSLEGKITKCERCGQPFLVKRMEEADECIYHWGKPYTTMVHGSKTRVYSCCSRSVSDGEGCTHGPHVFYESKPEELHSRYPFSFLNSPSPGSKETVLDVAAIDCEMIYTTGGMRVARVSVVDGTGAEVFDQLVRMDEGVHVIDYITRFSGITDESMAGALLPLASIRKSLDSLLDSDTIIIGHALDNDLKTLRIIHHKCVDSVLLFPHRAGPPYRRSLKDLVREKLGKIIQSGDGSVGHSSVEDAVATLDLIRWYITDQRNIKRRTVGAMSPG